MDNLILSGKQDFMGKEIPVVVGGFGEDKKCICDKTIAEIHSMENRHVRERITQNIKRFKENIDFIDLKQRVGETGTLEFLQDLGYAKQSITQAEHIYLLSERGYSKLIKIMDTDLAWEIHDNIMDEYFQMREEKQKPKSSAEMLLMYAQQFYEQEQRINAIEGKLREVESKVITHNEDYYTIAGYASLRGLNVDINRANMLGRKASKVSRKYGYDIGKVQDPRFGTVNTYHVDVLKCVFDRKGF